MISVSCVIDRSTTENTEETLETRPPCFSVSSVVNAFASPLRRTESTQVTKGPNVPIYMI